MELMGQGPRTWGSGTGGGKQAVKQAGHGDLMSNLPTVALATHRKGGWILAKQQQQHHE